MKKKLLTIACFFCVYAMLAQTIVKGTVKDNTDFAVKGSILGRTLNF